MNKADNNSEEKCTTDCPNGCDRCVVSIRSAFGNFVRNAVSLAGETIAEYYARMKEEREKQQSDKNNNQ